MKASTFRSLAAVVAIAASPFAVASPITVAGITWDPDSFFDFTSNSNLIEKVITGIGDELTGFGQVTAINQSASFGTAELTYQFGGFTLANIVPGSDKTNLVFTGGWIKIYADMSHNYDVNSYASAGDGTLFLDLAAHSNFNAGLGLNGTLFGDIQNGTLGTGQDDGGGAGLMDVMGGAAAGNFNTNRKSDFFGGKADFTFSSSYQPLPNGPTSQGYQLFGTGEFSGNSIPEPSSLALAGLGLFGFAALRRRKQ